MRNIPVVIAIALLTGCASTADIGKVPSLSPVTGTDDFNAMVSAGALRERRPGKSIASLWHSGPSSLLGDRRARSLGDLLTVVIAIDDKAELSNSSSRARQGSEKMGVPALLGIPQLIDRRLPGGATSANAVDLSSSSSANGSGSVKRNEKLTLRIAATVTGVLPNGYLKIHGSQEVRVNYELRELLVTGFVRPEDISRNNEITYDKIASARISYGGRGQISTAQQPRPGQQFLDRILPF